MSYRYSHLLSPLKIRNVLLKNRMLHPNAMLHFLQGPETFPTDALITYFANLAKNGAAVVTCRVWERIKPRTGFGDMPHMVQFDVDDPSVHNYFSHLTEQVHFYASKVCAPVAPAQFTLGNYSISEITEDDLKRPEMRGVRQPAKEATPDKIQELIDGAVKDALFYKSVGFDMINLYASYRASILAHSLSPVINKRTDQYGGSIENRARLIIELCKAIKQACGDDFLIELQMSGEETTGGYTIEDTVKYARLLEGVVDILELRALDGSLAHPTGFNSQKRYPITLRYAQAIKESGAKIVTAPVGGYQDLDLNEEYIATGKTDMIAMARAFICDSDYSTKAYEGRGEDVVPCIRCNKCHVQSLTGPWNSVCSVNPTVGIAHKVERMITPPGSPKKVAVIGGGPAGMKAAIIAADRGHKVTLYEKEYYLGGQLRHADYSSFKWPLRNFKDYLISQIEKKGVEVLLSTEATPELIKAGKYDVIMIAAGADPIIPDIPGADGPNVWTPINVYGHEQALGKRIVVVGGAEIGVETGMYLAENRHNVTLLTRQKKLAYDATPIHYREMFQDAWEGMETFSYITEATTTGITAGKVTYVDAKGMEKTIETDSVVVSAGLNPCHEEAMKFYGSSERFYVIGDCREVGNVQKCMRSAFAAASLI